jgi:hypothetical protein
MAKSAGDSAHEWHEWHEWHEMTPGMISHGTETLRKNGE